MEKTVKVTMSIDSELKRQAELLCKDMGLSLSTAYTMLLKAIVRTRSIPFTIEAKDPFYSDVNQSYLRESIDQLNNGKGKEHELIDA